MSEEFTCEVRYDPPVDVAMKVKVLSTTSEKAVLELLEDCEIGKAGEIVNVIWPTETS